MARRYRTVLVAVCLLSTVPGCMFRFGKGSEGRLRYVLATARSSDNAHVARCAAALMKARDSHDSYSSWIEALLYVGVGLGATATALSTAAGKSSDGENAASVADAAKSQGELSRLDIGSIVVAGLTAVAAGVTVVLSKTKGERLERINKLVEIINRLGKKEPVPAGELELYCPSSAKQ